MWVSDNIVESIVILKSFILEFCPKPASGISSNSRISFLTTYNIRIAELKEEDMPMV
jgi:hypothetical protein